MIVRLLRIDGRIQVKFDYDPKLTKIMLSFQAKYYRKTKVWIIHEEKLEDLKEELTFQGYTINDLDDKNYKVIRD